jgi:DNA-binding Xre family transcriptional regulator
LKNQGEDGGQPSLRTNNTKPNVESTGDVVCRLDVVLLAARRQHGLDSNTLSAMTHIDQRVLEALEGNQKTYYDVSVFKRLCYVCGVGFGTLLEYLTPEQLLQERARDRKPQEVTLPALYLRTPLPEDCGRVYCLLQQIIASKRPDFLAQLGKPRKRHVSYPDLESLWGIKAQRLADWANNVPTRYHRSAMAQLCHALHLRVDDIWRYDPPALEE